MTWSIGPLTREEVPEAVAVMLTGSLAPADEHPEDPERYWAATLATRERGGEVLVARDASGVVGVVELMILPHFQHTGGWCAELESFFVRPDRRSQGVGAALLAEAEERAARAGCYRIQLTSRNVRTDAHRFYRRHGFDQGSQGFKKALTGPSGDGDGYADRGGGDEQQR